MQISPLPPVAKIFSFSFIILIIYILLLSCRNSLKDNFIKFHNFSFYVIPAVINSLELEIFSMTLILISIGSDIALTF